MANSSPSTQDEPAGRGDGWGVGVRVWLERAGEAVLGPGRLELLESVGRRGSISAAARELGMSYRRAWELIRSMNDAAGEPLVTAAKGGVRGGGARVTPLGDWAVALFREVQSHLRHTADGLLRQRPARPGDGLHVAAAASLEEVLGRLLNDYAVRRPAVRTRVVFGASDELAGRLLAGAPADLFLTADPRQLDPLRRAGLLQRGAPADLAANGLAAIAPAGRSVSVRKPADLAAVSRVALAVPECPLGAYTRAYLESLRLYGPLTPRALRVESSRAVAAAVRAGQADVGLVYSSDAGRAPGCRTLFRVRRTPVPIRYAGAVLSETADPAAARSLLAFLTSAAATRRFRECGFFPSRKPSRES